MITGGNQTLYEITDTAHRATLTTWCFLTATISVVGNIVVLVASLKYNAIKLDKISVVLIRNIAIADLAYALLVILQVGISLAVNSWPYGDGHDGLCHLSTYLQHALAFTDILLICGLNISKLTCVMFPHRAFLRSKRTGHVIAFFVWMIAQLWSLESLARSVYFDYRSYRCAYLNPTPPGFWEWLDPLNVAVFLLVPNVIVIITTVWLLVLVKKSTGMNKQAVFTMLPVSIVFCVSCAPIGAYFVAEKWIMQAAGENMPTDFWYRDLYRYGMLVKFANNSANPLIYYVTLRSFRQFVQRKIFPWNTIEDDRKLAATNYGTRSRLSHTTPFSRQLTYIRPSMVKLNPTVSATSRLSVSATSSPRLSESRL